MNQQENKDYPTMADFKLPGAATNSSRRKNSSITYFAPILIILLHTFITGLLICITHPIAIQIGNIFSPVEEHWKNAVIFGDWAGIALFGGATLIKLFQWLRQDSKNPDFITIKNFAVSTCEEIFYAYSRYYSFLWLKTSAWIFLMVAFVSFVFDKPAVF